MDVLTNLLALYVGILIINVALSAVFWARQGSALDRNLFLVWTASALSLLAQGVLSSGDLWVTIGFSSAFVVDAALARLLASVARVRFELRPYVVALGLAMAFAVVAHALNAPFWWVSLPVAMAIAAPLLVTCIRILTRKEHGLTVAGRALTYSSLLFCAHNLDYPFLRDQPSLATAGFTIAVLIAFAISITAPAVVLEITAEERARIAEIDRLKTQFFANISHELRTPLTLILSPLDDLLASTPEGQERDVLKTVRRNGVRLLRLIDDLLDLAQLEAGGLRLQVAQLDVAELARSVVEACGPTADARSIQLSLTSCGRGALIFGDRHRLEMVLTNLVGNALKFTPEQGRIEVSLQEDDQGARISVADTGPGIPSGDLPRIFERFYQVQGDSQAPRGGAGIGLALARELTERHGGTLSVDSQLGQGATFTLWLPAGRDSVLNDAVERRRAVVPTRERRRAEDHASIDPLPPSSAPKLDRPAPEPILLEGGRRARIVVAEDDSELSQFICSVLEPDFETLRATDGNQALSLTRAETPDLVLADLMMPGLSGIEVCRKIKADPGLRHTPVILLTARSGSESTLEGYAAGADDFVVKPFHTRVLVARVTAQLRLRALSLQLAAQARLISTTTLAAGLSHEVRNPLNALMNSVRVLQDGSRAVDLPPTAHKLLAVIQDSAHRILDVVATLDAHARPADAGSVAPCHVPAGIDSTLRLLQHRLDGIEVHRDYSGTQLILAPSGEFNIVFANLLENAIRSRPRNLHISVSDHGQQVRIVISDDGLGVPSNIAARIFDPFFTTRPVGEGTGLGLYLCRRLVTERGGTLRHEPRPGGGASFVIEIPVEHSSRVAPHTGHHALPA